MTAMHSKRSALLDLTQKIPVTRTELGDMIMTAVQLSDSFSPVPLFLLPTTSFLRSPQHALQPVARSWRSALGSIARIFLTCLCQLHPNQVGL